MKIALGTDHAGFPYKELLKQYLMEKGHEVVDFGAHSNESSDYPDFIRPAAQAAASGECDCAVVFGGSGNGEQIAANKVKGVRCALTWSVETATLAKQHNNANVISIGQRVTPQDQLFPIVDAWLQAEFEGGRHLRRINKIEPEA